MTHLSRSWRSCGLLSPHAPYLATAAIAFLCAMVCGLWPSTARAVDIDLTDNCPGSVGNVIELVAAIDAANTNSMTDTIILAPGCVYTMTTTYGAEATYGLAALPLIAEPLTIRGNGATILRDPSATDFRLVLSAADPLTLQTLTFKGGKVSGEIHMGVGGAVVALGGELVILESTFVDNSARFAGGAMAAVSGSRLTISDTTFIDNAVVGPTLPGGGSGGAVATDAPATIVNSTFSGNSAFSENGSALFVGFFSKTTVGHSTFSGGDSPGPAIRSLGVITMTNTLVAAQDSGIDCNFDLPASASYNLADDKSCGEGFVEVDPSQVRLGPLAYNGGPNLTHDLMSGSAALNAGDPAFVPPPEYDQRGSSFPRVLNGRLDIGAIERPAYSIGGTVKGLAGQGLVLQLNGSFTVAVTANGPFTFTPYLLTGNGYVVTALSHPTNLGQTCTLTKNSGTVAFSNVSDIAVNCVTVFVEFFFFVDGNGLGDVSCSPVGASGLDARGPAGVRGGEGCDDVYPMGEVIDVLATPWIASNFAGWSGDCTGDQPQCTLTMSETRMITATFTTNFGFLPITSKE